MKSLSKFFFVAYGISWTFWSPYYLPSLFGSDAAGQPLYHLLGSFGPLIAAFIVARTESGKAGVEALLRSLTNWRTGGLYLFIALVGPFVILTASVALSYVFNHTDLSCKGFGVSREWEGLSFVGFALVNLLVFGFGEETGWRGFALPRLQQRFNALTSSIILTGFWAIWHWPLFFYRLSGYHSMDIAGSIGWIFSLLIGSIILTFLFNSTRGSILVCSVFHATVDIAFTSDFLNKNLVNYNGMLITIAGLLVLFIARPENLSRQEKVKAPGYQA